MRKPNLVVVAALGLLAVLFVASGAMAAEATSEQMNLTPGTLVPKAGPWTAGPPQQEDAFFFPSALSAVVGSVGFIDDEQVGYFWSVSRGASVSEVFAGPPRLRPPTASTSTSSRTPSIPAPSATGT